VRTPNSAQWCGSNGWLTRVVSLTFFFCDKWFLLLLVAVTSGGGPRNPCLVETATNGPLRYLFFLPENAACFEISALFFFLRTEISAL
jgi:hypothetical protein